MLTFYMLEKDNLKKNMEFVFIFSDAGLVVKKAMRNRNGKEGKGS